MIEVFGLVAAITVEQAFGLLGLVGLMGGMFLLMALVVSDVAKGAQ